MECQTSVDLRLCVELPLFILKTLRPASTGSR